MAIIATTRNTVSEAALAQLATVGQVRPWGKAAVPAGAELVEHLADCAAVLAPAGNFTADVLEALPQLRLIALPSAGYDSVDIAAANNRGITVTHVRGVLGETVADLTFALLLTARRRLQTAQHIWATDGWAAARKPAAMGLDVVGARLGLIGYGEIAQAVARRAAGFNMEIVHTMSRRGADQYSRPVSFNELLESCDVISVHVPLTDETRGLIGAAEIGRMLPNVTILNVARGGIVDEAALLAALDGGQVHSAGLDVYDAEPQESNSALVSHPHVVALPHIGSATVATRQAMEACAVDNIVKFFTSGETLTPVLPR